MNNLAPEQLGTLDGPQSSECNKEKGMEESLLLIGYDTQCCLENSQTSP